MTISHASGNLGLRDYLTPVDYQDKYFSFLYNNSSGRGEHPTSEIVSRYKDPAWGEVIAIEDATTNLMNQNVSSWGSTVVGVDPSTWLEHPVYYADGKAGGAGFLHNALSNPIILTGETVTYSMWINRGTANLFPSYYLQGQTYDDVDLTWTIRDPIHSYTSRTFKYYDVTNKDITNGFNYANFTGWVKIIVLIRNIHTSDIKLTNSFFLSTSFTSGRCYHSQPQLEKKEYATSFVNESRNAGLLEFDKSVVPSGNLTINMWISNTGDTRIESPSNRILSLGSGASYGRFTLWNYMPITVDAFNRRMVADFGTDDVPVRQFVDLVDSKLFIPEQWDMLTVSLDIDNKTFKIYRNGILFGTYVWLKTNPIESLTLSNSGWKYANLLLSPRIVDQNEIESWYEYGRQFYDPYDYQLVYG